MTAGPALAIDLACPACGATLPDPARCGACGREYGSVAGLPDLRLEYPDPSVSLEDDLERAQELADAAAGCDFPDLLRHRWRFGDRPAALVERFVAGDLGAVSRSDEYLDAIERARGRGLGAGDLVLEVGCGTGALAVAAAARGARVVATDISMRWIVVAAKRIAEAGAEGITLVCSSAEHPPFPPGSFDVVVASDVIEHAERQADFVAGCARMLKPGGMLFLATPNRFSLGLEPHVRLWGVGWLPRPLAERYVRAVRKSGYDHVHLLSAPKLRRVLRGAGLRPRIVPPEIPPATQELYRGPELALVRTYNRVRRYAPVRAALLAVGPFFHVFARKGPV